MILPPTPMNADQMPIWLVIALCVATALTAAVSLWLAFWKK